MASVGTSVTLFSCLTMMRDVGRGAGVEAGGVPGHVDHHRERRDVGALAADQADGADRPVDVGPMSEAARARR